MALSLSSRKGNKLECGKGLLKNVIWNVIAKWKQVRKIVGSERGCYCASIQLYRKTITMPITDYNFQNGIFSAKEIGDISDQDAQEWAAKLTEHARQSPTKIIALVDALEVKRVVARAVDIFSKASFTPNLIAVVVATNNIVSSTATNIGLLGRRNQTLVFRTLQEAKECCEKLLAEDNKRSTATHKTTGTAS